MNDTLLLATAAVVLVGWGVFVFTMACRGDTLHGRNLEGICAPSRHATITASTKQPVRHIVTQLAPPPGWHEPEPVAIPAPAAVEYDGDDLDDLDDEPETELPIAVPSWPTRQTVEPETVPVVVNRTAARFAAIEVRR